MAVSYKKLFHLLIDRGVPAARLTEQAGFSANILTRLRRNQYVSLESIEKICVTLGCDVDDILDFVTVNETGNEEEGKNENKKEENKENTEITVENNRRPCAVPNVKNVREIGG